RYLLEHLSSNVSLDDLVGLTGLTRFHLLRTFARTVGVPPHEFVILARITCARRELEAGHRPLDIAMSLGFADQSHFGRHFKRLVGVSPAMYAAMARKKAISF
ncbi:MAG TPA: AraC family transcriptional regulator, partial [Kofleriaceae bacterium]